MAGSYLRFSANQPETGHQGGCGIAASVSESFNHFQTPFPMKKLILFVLTFAVSTLVFATQKPVFNSEKTVYQADSTELKAYAGTYTFAQNDNFKQFVVTVENGELYGAVDAYPKNKLVKQATADTFKSTSEYGSVFTFSRDAATKAVTGFKIQIMGNEVTAKKDK
jgi:hypothetical protein